MAESPSLSAISPGTPVVVGTVPVSIYVQMNFARRWLMVLSNNDTGAKEITRVRVRRYPLASGVATPWNEITTDVPIAAGDTWSLEPETDDCSDVLEVELTASADGTPASLTLVGI